VADAARKEKDIGQEMRLKVECVDLNYSYKTVQSEIKEITKLVSEESVLELELDFNELQELQVKSTRPLVRNILASIPMKLKAVFDIAAERDRHEYINELTAIYNIETVITSESTEFNKGRNDMEISKTTHSSATRRNNIKEHHDRRSEIIVLGDKHTRGYAGEILHHVKQSFKIIGYVKPSAGVLVLSNTTKEEISKLSKKDILIFW
jgi:hypothetical protein